ncbi:MAG: SpaH/EbpB family LPXTG-anchored major pilin [Lactobacillus sp.]|jgi:fimbrial isopeptide formation D2 family protein|nr:SpaH/EbpB family LPXTG-anchored major pilin [Lactobacillus sp.]
MIATTNRKIGQFLMALMLCLPLFMGLFQASVVQGAEAPPSQTLTLHKRLLTETGSITNDGNILPNAPGKPLADVEFTAYDVTDLFVALKKQHPTWTADQIFTALQGTAPEDYQDKKNFKFKATDGEGVTSTDLPTKSEDNNNKNAVYLIAETKTPAGIDSTSVPIIIGLPFTGTGTTPLENVHLYPKNYMPTKDIEFTKYAYTHGNQATKELAGATFSLTREVAGGTEYYTGLDSDGHPVFADDATKQFVFTSDAKGLVQIENIALPNGTYQFREIASVDPFHMVNWGQDGTMVKVTVNGKTVTYDYYDLAGKPQAGQTTAKVYNYDVPEVDKKIAGDKADFDYNQEIPFQIEVPIPLDMTSYTQFELIDTPDARLQLLSALDALKVQVLDGDTVVATLGATATATDDGGFKFDLIGDKEVLLAHPGKMLRVDFKMKIKAGADLDTNIENRVDFNNNFTNQTDKEIVTTHGYNFLKVDSHNDKVLPGAKFVVYKTVGDQKLYRSFDEKTNLWDWVEDIDNAYAYTSDKDGQLSIQGLATGDYVLQETQAPDGYILPTGDGALTAFTVTEDSFTTTKTEPKKIENGSKSSLPITGGLGIIGLIAVSVLGVTGALVYFKKRRA